MTTTCWIDAANGVPFHHSAAIERMSQQQAVLLGEQHDRPEDHRFQALVIAGLAARHTNVHVGFEMFPRRAQPALDQWVAGDLSEQEFLDAASWPQVWGMDPELYLPLFRLCRDLRLPMHALNVDRPLVTLIGREGWEATPPDTARWLTPAASAPAAYREYLFAVTGGARPDRKVKSPDDPAFDRFVRAQQVWDRAFACVIAEVAQNDPSALTAGIIGRGHLEFGYGTPAQLENLGIDNIIIALPENAASADKLGRKPQNHLLFIQP